MAMPFAGAFDRLQPRERLLLGVMGIVVAVFVVFLILFGVSSAFDSIQDENEENAEVLREIALNRSTFLASERKLRELDRRYATRAPALQSFLEEKATKRGLEIRDAQDRPEVQHGKQFVERSVKIRLNKVEIRSFVQLMEDITTSRHPLAITDLRVRRRIAEQNSFDVEMTVSAFDRVVEPTKTAPGRTRGTSTSRGATTGSEAPGTKGGRTTR